MEHAEMKNYDYFTSSSYTSGWETSITQNEDYGRKAVEDTITTFLKDDVEVEFKVNTTITDPIDLVYQVKKGENNYRLGIEVKNWSKPCTFLGTPDKKIPDSVMLKLSKLERMLEYSRKNNLNFVLYVAILDNKAYYFDVSRIDYEKIPSSQIRQKETQMNPNSQWKNYYTFFIPLSDAYKVINIKEEK